MVRFVMHSIHGYISGLSRIKSKCIETLPLFPFIIPRSIEICRIYLKNWFYIQTFQFFQCIFKNHRISRKLFFTAIFQNRFPTDKAVTFWIISQFSLTYFKIIQSRHSFIIQYSWLRNIIIQGCPNSQTIYIGIFKPTGNITSWEIIPLVVSHILHWFPNNLFGYCYLHFCLRWLLNSFLHFIYYHRYRHISLFLTIHFKFINPNWLTICGHQTNLKSL